jgi:AraC-like DNA-binding protein
MPPTLGGRLAQPNSVGCHFVSRDGQCAADVDPSAAVSVVTFPMPAGTATMRSLYIRPDLCPITWPDCTPVLASPLLAEIISYLADVGLDPDRRGHAETILVDLLRPVGMTTMEVRMPTEERCQQVADALTQDPADGRTLAEWGREVGASERTLARLFVAGTGLPFGRWRALLRLRAAMPALAAGEPVTKVARHVGYESASAFVAAFRRETGLTPGRYFHDTPEAGRTESHL